jgi:hypothetical protein
MSHLPVGGLAGVGHSAAPFGGDRMTARDWRQKAAFIRLQCLLFETSAEAAETGYGQGYGPGGSDFGQNVALRLRECAREAAWLATQLDVIADEEPCVEDVGRTDDDRPANFAIAPRDVA